MAQIATYTEYANGGKQPHYEGKVTFSIEQNIEGNYFTVSYWYWLYRDDGFTGPAHNFTNGNKLLVYINGDKLIDDENYKTVTLTGTSAANPFLMCSGQHKVPANTDGSKTFAFSFMYDQTQDRGQELDYLTVAGEHTCEPIPRATAPTLSASSIEFGKAVTITTNRASTSFTHTLRYKLGEESATIKAGVTTSQSWTVPLSLMNQIPNATSGNITIYCDTYNGSDLIGTKTVTLKATVPSSIVPTLSIAIAEAAYIPSNISGYVQNKSKVKVTSTAAGTYKSTIKNYAVTVDGAKYNGASITSNILANSGTIAVSVVVTDSRGRTTTVSKNIEVLAYSAPKITSSSAYRCNSATDPTSNPLGEYICVKPRGSIASLSNKNGKSCRVYYKKNNAETYSSVSVSMSDYVLDTEYVIFAAAGDSSYDIYTTLSDSFSSSEFDTPDVQTTEIPMDALMDEETEESVRGWAFGKQVEIEKATDFGWDVYFRKNVTTYNAITNASDKRLKRDFAPVPEIYLDLVDALKPELFRFENNDTYLNVGLVAQKVLDMETFFGITESLLVRGTGLEIPDPKNPDKVMVDYYSIDYQAYNILRSMALERKVNRLLSKLGLEV